MTVDAPRTATAVPPPSGSGPSGSGLPSAGLNSAGSSRAGLPSAGLPSAGLNGAGPPSAGLSDAGPTVGGSAGGEPLAGLDQPDGRASSAAPGTARFVTGDAISLDLQVAQLGSRTLARMIDFVVQLVLLLILVIVSPVMLALLSLTNLVVVDEALFTGVMVLIIAVVFLGYPVTMETLAGGRTLGKLAMGLRVVRIDGGPIRLRQALTRGLVGTAVEWPGLVAPPLTWLACVWTMVVNRHGRRIGDFAAGTLVIHERTPAVWGSRPWPPPDLAAWATTLDLAALDDDLALAVRHFLTRAPAIREPARSRLAHRLMAEVAAVTRPGPPPGVPAWAYLAAVHAERHRRARHRLAALRTRVDATWSGWR